MTSTSIPLALYRLVKAVGEVQKEDLQKRFKLENERYFELYNIHKEDLANYDLVINTSNITPAQVANVIIEEYEKWLNK